MHNIVLTGSLGKQLFAIRDGCRYLRRRNDASIHAIDHRHPEHRKELSSTSVRVGNNLVREACIGIAAARHRKIRRVPVVVSHLHGRRCGEFVLKRLRKRVVSGQCPRLRVHLHRWKTLDEWIRRRVNEPRAVVMRGQSRVSRQCRMRLQFRLLLLLWLLLLLLMVRLNRIGVPRDRSATAAGGRTDHVRRIGHAVRGVRQRHGRAVRIGDDGLGRIVRQRRRRRLDAAKVAVLRERGHSHVRGAAERLLVGIQRIDDLGPGQSSPDDDGRLVRVLEDDGRAAGLRLVRHPVEYRTVIDVLGRKILTRPGSGARRRERRVRCGRLAAALERTAPPLVLLSGLRAAQVVDARRSSLAVATLTRVARVRVHAARTLAVAARLTVRRRTAADAAAADERACRDADPDGADHRVQGRRGRRVRTRRELLVRHSRIGSAQASRCVTRDTL